MSKSIAPELSVLQSSKNGLVYLTANDWALVADKASRAHFKKGDALVQRGKKADRVYLLLKGTARVQIRSQSTLRVIGSGFAPGRCLSARGDRKSTRLNSSHQIISYAVFCLKKNNISRNVKREVAAGHEVPVVVSAMPSTTNPPGDLGRGVASLHY